MTRAFNQFLNLANLAEQYHGIRRAKTDDPRDTVIEEMQSLFERLKAEGITSEEMNGLLKG